MRQRDVVWVRLPYTDLERSKARPAVVLSNDAYNTDHPDVVVCAVTSNLQPTPYKVPLSTDDLTEGHLPLESMARADKILQVEKGLIDHSFARVNAKTYDQITAKVAALVTRQEA